MPPPFCAQKRVLRFVDGGGKSANPPPTPHPPSTPGHPPPPHGRWGRGRGRAPHLLAAQPGAQPGPPLHAGLPRLMVSAQDPSGKNPHGHRGSKNTVDRAEGRTAAISFTAPYCHLRSHSTGRVIRGILLCRLRNESYIFIQCPFLYLNRSMIFSGLNGALSDRGDSHICPSYSAPSSRCLPHGA